MCTKFLFRGSLQETEFFFVLLLILSLPMIGRLVGSFRVSVIKGERVSELSWLLTGRGEGSNLDSVAVGPVRPVPGVGRLRRLVQGQ